MSLLKASAAAGESGPVIMLSGEADFSTVAQVSELITAQLSSGTRHLMIDMSELRFADSASIRVLVMAARTLHQRGGNLVLVRPQPAVVRVLTLMGADQMLTILGPAHGEPETENEAGGNVELDHTSAPHAETPAGH